MKRFAVSLILCAAIAIAAGGFASARNAEGRLSFAQGPTSTRPIFARGGDKIPIDVAVSVYNSCSCSFHAFLIVGGNRMEIALERGADVSTETYRFMAVVPTGLFPNLYDLALHKGPNDDVEPRAVAIVEKYPGEYTIMHISGVYYGREKDGVPIAARMFEKIREKANELKPDMVLITGDATEAGTSEQLKGFVEALGGFKSPTFVARGERDDKAGQAGGFLGSGAFGFSFGEGYFVGFDPIGERELSDPSGRWDELNRLASEHAGAKFLALFGVRSALNKKPMISKILEPARAKLLLLGGDADRAEKVGSAKTVETATSAAADGNYRILRMSNDRIVDMRVMNAARPKESSKKKKGTKTP